MKNYGEWKSPITLDVVTSQSPEITNSVVDPVSGELFWLVKKPSGQFVICSGEHESNACEWMSPEFSAVSRVHEYGGGEFFAYNKAIYFVNKTDQRLYKQTAPDVSPVPITESFGDGKLRYADAHFCEEIKHIVCVREDHREEGKECINTVVAIEPNSGKQTILCTGSDFYKDVKTFGKKITFVSWYHPNMPWDSTTLSVGDIVTSEDGAISIENVQIIKSGTSALQPSFLSENTIFYLSDSNGYYNVWRSDQADRAWFKCEKETGFPFGWIFGYPGYAKSSKGLVVGARDRLLLIDDEEPQKILKDLGDMVRDKGYSFGNFANISCHGSFVYTLGIDDCSRGTTLLRISLEDDSVYEYNVSCAGSDLIPYISTPKSVRFPTGDEGKDSAFGYLYLPTNPDYTPDPNEKPPLLVEVHGGPTGMTKQSLSFRTQYFTSRGFAVFDVDYRGSTGYGRAYRQAMYGRWGVCDVEDAINAAKHVVAEGLVDEKKLAIAGGSAGGYTTMAVMTFRDYFHAGVSYYGVSDLLELAKFTHKFQSRYIDQMIGKLPEMEALYKERSPLYHANQLSGAIGFFLGSCDFVVPPPQSQAMYKAALENEIPTFYVEFEGEAHGFKKASSIQRCLSNEMYFYGKMFGFDPCDETENPPPIKNLRSN